jgi:hypothetical protein
MLLHDLSSRPIPPLLVPYMEETKKVINILHNEIHRRLLVLFAMVLEVPEEAILDMHRPGGSTTNYYRYVSRVNLSVPFFMHSLTRILPCR